MAPHLRVLVGTSPETLVPISNLVNTNEKYHIASDIFEGDVVVNIKGFTGEKGEPTSSPYFEREDKQGITWSIQVQGRFLTPHSADDILFGNTFDRPLHLPWGSSAALKFMHFIDPTLEHDLTSQSKPWALSPLISTMPHFAHSRIGASPYDRICYFTPPPPSDSSDSSDFDDGDYDLPTARPNLGMPTFPPPNLVTDDTSLLHLAVVRPTTTTTTTAAPLTYSINSSHAPTPVLHSSSSLDLSEAALKLKSPSSHSLASDTSSIRSVSSTKSWLSSARSSVTSLSLRSNGSNKETEKKKKKKKHSGGGGGQNDGTAAGKRTRDELFALRNASQRRSYFASRTNREKITFGPNDVITTDFCYGFLEFSPSLALKLPGGLSFDLMKYWDGQPVRFVCCERKHKNKAEAVVRGRKADASKAAGDESGSENAGNEKEKDNEQKSGNTTNASGSGSGNDPDGEPWGRIFWCVSIEIVDKS